MDSTAPPAFMECELQDILLAFVCVDLKAFACGSARRKISAKSHVTVVRSCQKSRDSFPYLYSYFFFVLEGFFFVLEEIDSLYV